MRHLITLEDVSSAEIERIYAITEDLKTKFQAGIREPLLPGRMMALLFEKQSLRTRVSFEACMTHLGGGSILLGEDAGFGKRESIADFTRVLSEMVDVIVVRSKKHSTVEEVAKYSKAAVVNGLTDESHPCQALADLYTLREHFGSLKGLKLAWVGDGNNVAVSLARGCAKVGMSMSVCAPEGYQLPKSFVDKLKQQVPGADITLTDDTTEAVAGADAIYTDVWTSMGQEAERDQRLKDFANYQVNGKLMAAAPKTAVFMHCLPAKRGEEVTDEVMDSPQSIIVPQAGNRMHVQKGILVWLLGSQA
ncbi:ornithine carbamoyltransferase [Aeoliella sp. SH292]|uniref:ornithine carbamoyltransferase n=1 Tax=Aeoliella sp. SH292 TaxID=3454464 RepID=UPI003F9EB483